MSIIKAKPGTHPYARTRFFRVGRNLLTYWIYVSVPLKVQKVRNLLKKKEKLTLFNSKLLESNLLMPPPSKIFSVWATMTGCSWRRLMMSQISILNSLKKFSSEADCSSWSTDKACRAGSTMLSKTYEHDQ